MHFCRTVECCVKTDLFSEVIRLRYAYGAGKSRLTLERRSELRFALLEVRNF